jgi:putative DNA primase/helicase
MNVISMSDYQAPNVLPAAITSKPTWLVWRLIQMPGQQKPRKVPHYPVSGKPREGTQGSPDDRAGLVSYDRAIAAVLKGRWSGVGIAMLKDNGLVAVDFDDCVKDGQIDSRVVDLCEGTYSEISPSGNGVRAFFAGTLPDRKDLKGDLKVEVFCDAGYVTVTGNVTAECAMWGWEDTVAPLTPAMLAFYEQRFGRAVASAADDDDDWAVSLSPKTDGMTIEKARTLVSAMDADGDYDSWLKVGQVLHFEFDGSDAGLEIWRDWSKKSSGKYPGDAALDAKWSSFGRYRGSPLTGRWLLKHAKVARVEQKYEAVKHWREQITQAEALQGPAQDKERALRETVCPGIAKDDRLEEVDREGLAQALHEAFRGLGLRLPIATVRTLVAPTITVRAVTAHKLPPLTEFGMTERMIQRFGDSLRYVPELAIWLKWTGVYWCKTTSVEVEHWAKETINDLPKEAPQHNDQHEFFGFCMLAQAARMVKNMVTLAASDPRINLPASELDKDAHLVGVRNGVLDIRAGALVANSPSLYVTKTMGCDFDPAAKCPLFMQSLQDSMLGDKSMVEFLQVLAGYILSGNPKQDIMVMPYGTGSNGKGTQWNAIRKTLGDYAKSAQPESFMESTGGNGGGGAREDLLRLRGARLVYVAEPEEGSELKEGLVKSMTGGDAITARGLYAKETITFEPTWTIVMPTNHKPIIKGSDNGIWRRVAPLPYLKSYKAEDGNPPDPNFREKVALEGPGILNWMLAGFARYQSQGLVLPEKVRSATEAYRSNMDLLAEWLDEKCEVGDGYKEESQRLWLSWQDYARDRGVLRYIGSAVSLGRRLDQRFPAAKGSGGTRVRLGIRLKRHDQNLDNFFD